MQLLGGEAVKRGFGDLASRDDLNGDPGVAQLPVHLLDPAGELRDADIVIVADVGGRGDDVDAVRGGNPRHRE